MSIIKIIKQKLTKSINKTPANYLLNSDWVKELELGLNIYEGDSVALCHKDWKGVRSSTIELFSNVILINEAYDNLSINRVANLIINSKIRQFILSGFPDGWSEIIKIVKSQKSQIVFKVLWHGSIAQHYEEYSTKVFLEILNLSKLGLISKLGFVKKSSFELYDFLGYDCCFVMNHVNIKTSFTRESTDLNMIKVGIFSADVTLRKNTYTNIASVCYLPNASLTICPSNEHLNQVVNHFNLSVKIFQESMPREEVIKLMSKLDVVLYVTFSECAPMIPLESMSVGTICLMGANNHYYEKYPILDKYLVVKEVDNP